MGDVVLIPLGAKQRVGKTQGNQVLYGLFAQIVVDAVNPRLGEHFTDSVVNFNRGVQVVTDGFFNHHAGLIVQAFTGLQVTADIAINRCTNGKIDHHWAR